MAIFPIYPMDGEAIFTVRGNVEIPNIPFSFVYSFLCVLCASVLG